MARFGRLSGVLRTLTGRMTLGVLAIHLVLVPVFFGGVLYVVKEGHEDQFINHVRAESRLLAARLAEELARDEDGERARLLQELRMAGNIVFVEVRDPAGRPMLGWREPARPPRVFREDFFFGQHGDGVYYVAVPMTRLDDTPLGTLRIGFDEGLTIEQIQAVYRQAGWIAAAYVVLTLVLIGLFGPYLTRSLARLRATSRRIAGGRIEEPFPAPRGVLDVAEVADLSEDLERMRRALLAQQRELAAREAYVRAVMDNVMDGIITIDEKGRIRSFNRAAERIFGYEADEVLDRNVNVLMPEAERTAHDAHIERYVRTGGSKVIGAGARELLGRRKDGTTFPVEIALSEMRIDGERFIVGIVRDVSKRKESERRLRLAAAVMEHANEAIIVADEARVIRSVNRAFSELTGYRAREARGRAIGFLFARRAEEAAFRRGWEAVRAGGEWRGQVWIRHRRGEVLAGWVSLSAIMDPKGRPVHMLCILSDITDRVRRERHLEHLAGHDPLTGLPNRNLLQDRLQRALAEARRRTSTVAVLFVDLDAFKPINDRFGHEAGDAVLAEVARRLTRCVRETDTVGRIGGDEFVVVLQDAGAAPNAARVAGKIIAMLVEPITVAGTQCTIGASVGISLYPGDGDGAEDLIRRADEAMYRAKAAGTNRYRYYGESAPRALDL